jgi:HPt (histidine-containing phosphotransfer) domain-containing protein
MPSPVILDPAIIAELRSLDPAPGDGLLRELMAIFVHDTPPRLTEMERSLNGGDAVAFGRAAHSIKGSAANLGARELHRAADEAERCARSGNLADGRARLDEIRAEFTRAREALGVMVGDGGQR